MKIISLAILLLTIVPATVSAISSPSQSGETPAPACEYEEDAQSAITECLIWVHGCGVGCCGKEQQAMNWHRCAAGGNDQKVLEIEKFYQNLISKCKTQSTPDECSFHTVVDSIVSETDCHTSSVGC